MFDEDKKKYLDLLYKPDLSKKGNVDGKISNLINSINKLDNYITTSSCSGRILLLVVSNSLKKHECEWPIVTHDLANVNEFWDALKLASEKFSESIWFKMESAILHVQCKTIASAQDLITMAKEIGFKRSGIFVTKPERNNEY
jgi:tRNA wybutosine-synthesizing protein 3